LMFYHNQFVLEHCRGDHDYQLTHTMEFVMTLP
jgi:hypothetical protein